MATSSEHHVAPAGTDRFDVVVSQVRRVVVPQVRRVVVPEVRRVGPAARPGLAGWR
ncbi:MAG: hypothetical protein M0Z82_02700 [Actinomycetota bacterium]|nr:hypothetical protein [Actinomycetota bacterium]